MRVSTKNLSIAFSSSTIIGLAPVGAISLSITIIGLSPVSTISLSMDSLFLMIRLLGYGVSKVELVVSKKPSIFACTNQKVCAPMEQKEPFQLGMKEMTLWICIS